MPSEPNLLIVDDEPDFLELEQVYLTKYGLDSTPCESASVALEELRRGGYDVIVSDYQMPETNGIEFLKTLRSEGHNQSFILFTGRGREDVAIDALNAGANFYIEKGDDAPSLFALLAKTIRQLDDARQSSKALYESERLLRIANSRMDLLGSITRHDIRNEVTLIGGHIALAADLCGPGKASEHLAKARDAAGKILGIIEIARVYQINGAMNLKWVPLNSTIDRSIASVPGPKVTITNRTGDWMILVDPMLEMICANIVSNSILHGERVTKIDISSEDKPDGLDLIIEDNGVGVAPEEKERIFTNLTSEGVPHGLTIARKILLAEGMMIKETGTYGEGAKFVLHFPAGSFTKNRRA